MKNVHSCNQNWSIFEKRFWNKCGFVLIVCALPFLLFFVWNRLGPIWAQLRFSFCLSQKLVFVEEMMWNDIRLTYSHTLFSKGMFHFPQKCHFLPTVKTSFFLPRLDLHVYNEGKFGRNSLSNWVMNYLVMCRFVMKERFFAPYLAQFCKKRLKSIHNLFATKDTIFCSKNSLLRTTIKIDICYYNKASEFWICKICYLSLRILLCFYIDTDKSRFFCSVYFAD